MENIERTADDKILSAILGMKLTDEQFNFAYDFTRSTLSMSDPGTGKTQSTVYGIMRAQKILKVPGKRILCLSYSNAAVSEIAGRYEKACVKYGISQSVNFKTFHSYSYSLLKLGFPDIKITQYIDRKSLVEMVSELVSEYTGFCTKTDARRILDSILKLNDRMLFDDVSVSESMFFKKLNLDLEVFKNVRRDYLSNRIVLETISQGEIPLFAYLSYLRNPELFDEEKKKYDIIIVDEFQDMSVLYFAILAKMAKSLVAIGDMKQQIYAFNGASPQIVNMYKDKYKDYRDCPLTQSFRCSNQIAEFATSVISQVEKSKFKGVGDGPAVSVLKQSNSILKSIVESIRETMNKNDKENIMFLCRNNSTLFDIMDKLYLEKIPFHCPRFFKIADLPIMSDLTNIIELARTPRNKSFAFKVLSNLNEGRGNVLKILKESHDGVVDFLKLDYGLKTQKSQYFFNEMETIKEMLKQRVMSNQIYNKAYGIWKDVFNKKLWAVEVEPEVIFKLVSPVLKVRDYETLREIEERKEEWNEINLKLNRGILCSTLHSSKGLEADSVYLLSIDDKVVPSPLALEECREDELAYYSYLRNEINLIYVGLTRAKTKCVVFYDEDVSSIIKGEYSIKAPEYASSINTDIAVKELMKYE